jgi:hypothetical protein
MIHWKYFTLACASLSLSIGAQAQIYGSLSGNGIVNRTNLTYSTMTGTAAALVDYSAYAVPVGAANPDANFQGTLTLTNNSTSGSIKATKGVVGSYTDPGHLPNFSYQFVQNGTHLIPVNRGLLLTTHANWNLILEPGRVWKETTDNGYSRAAVPFALQQKLNNCTHNGVMSFLFKDGGSISNVSYQIAGETCAYFQFNAWGNLSATYTPAAVSGAATLIAAYETEVSNRMPAKPIAALATDYPTAGITLANIGSQQTAAYMTMYGVSYNGINYVGGCNTRYGTYPYCEVLDLPSYSTAKSMVGAIGLMRTEQKYSGTQKTLSIGSLVPECTGSQWVAPTMLNALDMATGNYNLAGFESDEGSTAMSNGFFKKATYADRVAFSCSYTNKKTPGTTWIYHTTDTFLLGRALQNIYRTQENSSTKDFFTDMLVAEIYSPLGMSPTSKTTLRTSDTSLLPYSGYGLTFHHDDFVKMGNFLYKDAGKIGGVPMLDSVLLSESMQQTSSHGLTTGTSTSNYHHGFWVYNAKADLGCSADRWIPYMSGYGGIGVVMLKNNMVYYYVSDKDEYGFINTVKELHKISSAC